MSAFMGAESVRERQTGGRCALRVCRIDEFAASF